MDSGKRAKSSAAPGASDRSVTRQIEQCTATPSLNCIASISCPRVHLQSCGIGVERRGTVDHGQCPLMHDGLASVALHCPVHVQGPRSGFDQRRWCRAIVRDEGFRSIVWKRQRSAGSNEDYHFTVGRLKKYRVGAAVVYEGNTAASRG